MSLLRLGVADSLRRTFEGGVMPSSDGPTGRQPS